MMSMDGVHPPRCDGSTTIAAEGLPEGCSRCGWYLSRREIECNSPSRKDGMDLKMETQLRLACCSFIKKLGMRFRISQVCIATATMFCHRFYLRQSYTKNDWQTIASACIFLASKVEDTPISLDKVVTVSYETIHKGDHAASQRIRQREAFEKRKTLILLSERVIMVTMGFDFNIEHPYTSLSKVMNKLGITLLEIRQRAWNFINDWLQTTLCLQYKPHYIAAGSLFITAQIFKLKLPTNRNYSWWHEFDVSPYQLNAVIQEIRELLGINKPVPIRPLQTPLLAKKDTSCSPDSVLTTPCSTKDAYAPGLEDAGNCKPASPEASISGCFTSGREQYCVNKTVSDPEGWTSEAKPQACIADKTVSEPEDGTSDAEPQAFIADQTVSEPEGGTSDAEPQACIADKIVSEAEGGTTDAEHTDGVVENSQTSTQAQPARIAEGLGNINLDKIKELIRKRKTTGACRGTLSWEDDGSEGSWIERELEAGVELEMGSSRKKMRLSS